MNPFRSLTDYASLLYLRWARRELTARDPMHADLPAIILRINELERTCGLS